MKKFRYILASALVGFAFTACEDDHEPDWNEPSPFDVTVSSVSIEDGATVGLDVNSIEVVYSNEISLNSLV